MTTKLDRIRLRAMMDLSCVFNNLGHILDLDLLYEQFKRLERKKAVGIDGITKQKYGEKLKSNLENLLTRIRKGTYKPLPAKLVEIPKEDGSKRPLAISCFEDKLVQSAVNAVLSEIYEPIFLPSSYGFRPGRSCHDALRALNRYTYQMRDGAVVEIDIKKYFNSIPTKELMQMLQMKISDKRFLRLVQLLMQTPTMKDGVATPNLRGCPQGSIISPTLANIYLHYVIDKWVSIESRNCLKGRVEMVRYADDMVFVFGSKADAERFFRVLPKRLEKFGLTLHGEKSQLLESGSLAAKRAASEGRKIPSYKFLGFNCYWSKARKGFWRLKYCSRKDRFTAKLKGMWEYLRKQLSTRDANALLKRVTMVIRGWLNYHAISDNSKRVNAFLYHSKHLIFKWFNRRGGNKKMNWNTFVKVLKGINFPERPKVTSMFHLA